MRNKNLIHELIPAEKRLAKIDAIDIELERRLKAKEITLVEYVAIKQPLTVKRFKEFRLVERAHGWNRFEALEPPTKVPIAMIEEPPALVEGEPPKPVAVGQRLLGIGVFVVLLVVLSWLLCWWSG